MKVAFCLYKYFPYGGMQRDFFRIAKQCASQGIQITAYVLTWQGQQPDWLNIEVAPVKASTNLRSYQMYTQWLKSCLLANPVDLVVGFNKMPGLDLYYAADPCYEFKAQHLRGWWYKYSRRYKHFSDYEKAVFGEGSTTQVLMISSLQKELFKRFYGTDEDRMIMLPPGINKDRCATPDAVDVRRNFRDEFNFDEDDLLVLQIGSGFRTKGVDRSLKAVAALPSKLLERTRLFIIGQDNPAKFKLLARRLGIKDRAVFFQGRDDIPRFLQGADLLMHPAYEENTGTVLLEAMVAGLPVLATETCGYACYIEEACAGEIAKSPFNQEAFNQQLETMLLSDKKHWKSNGITYAESADIYSMPQRAAEVINQMVTEKVKEHS